MSEIFVFNKHFPPVTTGEIKRRVLSRGGCFNTHHVHWRHLLLLDGGVATLSHMTAPDAESARIALRQAGFAVGQLWPAECVYGGENDKMQEMPANVLFERHGDTPVMHWELDFITSQLTEAHPRVNCTGPSIYLSQDRHHLFILFWSNPQTFLRKLLPATPGDISWRYHRCQQVVTCLRESA